MDPRRVLTFREVARQRSFSRAARELSLSQPSVSNQVALLERELGVRLLQRAHGGLRLTPEGEILLNHADAVAERFALAEAQLAAAVEGARAQLRIGAFPTALAALVPGAIERLRRDHPGVRVTADEGGDELAGRVRDGALHLALAFQAADESRQEPVGLERRDLVREEFVVALPPAHPLAEKPEVPLEALADADWTAGAADGPIVRACRAAGFEPRLISLTDDPLAVRALVARGLAVTLVPELLFEPVEGLARRPVQGTAPARDVYALLPPGGRHPLASEALAALEDAVARLRGSESVSA